MSRKAPLALVIVTSSFVLTGCATIKPPAGNLPPESAAAPLAQPTPPPTPAPQIRPVSTSQPATSPNVAVAADHSDLIAMIGGQVEDQGNALLVTRAGTATAPVPLFRQAIVLANVRAALTGHPAGPSAEFRRGILNLTFRRGTPVQMAAAINRTLLVPEVTRLRVVPGL